MRSLHRWLAPVAVALTMLGAASIAPAAFAATTDAAVLAACANVPAWAEGTAYAAGAQVTYQGRLYRARVAHTPPVGAGWNPVAAASLWEDLGACDSTPPTDPPPTDPPPTDPPPTTGGLPHAPYVDM